MKTTLTKIATVASVAIVLSLGIPSLRADEPTPSPHRQHKAAQKARSSVPTKDDRNAQEVQGGVVGGATGSEYRVRTGSHIPEHYHRQGYSTDSRDNESIYDHNDIRLQNSNTVGDALRQVPGVTISGRR